MLDEDYSENKSLILSSLEGIKSVFDLQVSLQSNRPRALRAELLVANPAKRFLSNV